MKSILPLAATMVLRNFGGAYAWGPYMQDPLGTRRFAACGIPAFKNRNQRQRRRDHRRTRPHGWKGGAR